VNTKLTEPFRTLEEWYSQLVQDRRTLVPVGEIVDAVIDAKLAWTEALDLAQLEASLEIEEMKEG
jgi:hypothetical protein